MSLLSRVLLFDDILSYLLGNYVMFWFSVFLVFFFYLSTELLGMRNINCIQEPPGVRPFGLFAW